MSTWVDEGTYVYYDGNVGIGTGATAPGAPLEVNGASIFDEPIAVYDNSSSTSVQEAPSIVNLVQEANAVSTWSILGFGGGYNFDQIGRIGFQLTATGDEEPHISTADFVVATVNTDDGSMTEKVRVTNDGNVGIGTASRRTRWMSPGTGISAGRCRQTARRFIPESSPATRGPAAWPARFRRQRLAMPLRARSSRRVGDGLLRERRSITTQILCCLLRG